MGGRNLYPDFKLVKKLVIGSIKSIIPFQADFKRKHQKGSTDSGNIKRKTAFYQNTPKISLRNFSIMSKEEKYETLLFLLNDARRAFFSIYASESMTTNFIS